MNENVENLLAELVRQLRVSNAIGLGQSLGLDSTEPVAAAKIGRALELVHNKFGENQ